ncbi:phosphatase PAP2 family protein [Streptomyces caniscabiei]|uniref:phosphatase PAP2 family protein n=1 Tax=Streptomyces caniscabiei TaxID=2746961 RepID=UPI0029ADCCFC|nr:phosphatase PAP2 family protein [Streptomyces caniscabiei]MDX2776027.1 phosphatase PAP2 family protein [Streptomyces caniscabiei]
MRSLLHRFDAYVTAQVQGWPHRLRPCMKIASFIGYPYVTLGVIATGFLVVGWSAGDFRYACAGGAIFITHGIGSFLKLTVGRQRPATYLPKRWHVKTHSFPSGHALGSTAAYGTIALILSNYGLLGMTGAVFLAVLVGVIGVSRIYLGAHYPSDVVAGWLFGGAGACIAASFLLS